MQVGILLYKNHLVGSVKFEAGIYDSDHSHHELLRTGIETQSSKLSSYLFYPRPEVNPSRSIYDDYGYYPYDGRVPMCVHRNHGQPISNRIIYSCKYLNYTYYELNDGTVAYTTNYEMKNRFYYEFGYDRWTISDTRIILKHINGVTNNTNLGISDLCLNLPLFILSSIWENLCFIFYMIVMVSVIMGALIYFFAEYEIRRRTI
jgi:hypothetical protein